MFEYRKDKAQKWKHFGKALALSLIIGDIDCIGAQAGNMGVYPHEQWGLTVARADTGFAFWC